MLLSLLLLLLCVIYVLVRPLLLCVMECVKVVRISFSYIPNMAFVFTVFAYYSFWALQKGRFQNIERIIDRTLDTFE